MILQGDCREVLATLPAESVQCCVTSPPYWGLRDYGLPPGVWGGDPECDHQWGGEGRRHRGGPHGPGVLRDGGRGVIEAQAAVKDINTGAFCSGCDAWRGQLGLEPTPALYVANLSDVFAEVWRVLRPDGTLWLNLGDTYATGAGATNTIDPKSAGRTRAAGSHRSRHYSDGRPPLGPLTQPNRRPIEGLKPKDLVGIPWRAALALQEDGWWLRSDIIWSKPNPMPESVTDRPTKAHEYVFLLSKSERYFYDAEAIAEPAGYAHEAKWDNGENGHGGGESHRGQGSSTRKFRSGNKERKYGQDRDRPGSQMGASIPWEGVKRNARSVWQIATRPFPDAHFAVFPPELARRCILAGSRPGDTVLDPFNGAGTAGLIAQEHGREYVGIELNPDYIEIAERRLAQKVLPLGAA